MFKGNNPITSALIGVSIAGWFAFIALLNVAWIAFVVWVIVKVLRALGVL